HELLEAAIEQGVAGASAHRSEKSDAKRGSTARRRINNIDRANNDRARRGLRVRDSQAHPFCPRTVLDVPAITLRVSGRSVRPRSRPALDSNRLNVFTH